jgi:flagellar assembly protein FliH
MAKAVFRPGEVVISDATVFLDPPKNSSELSGPVVEEAEAVEEKEVYTGPTADDLRREAELFKTQWETEREIMIRSAKMEAETIIRDARDTASQDTDRMAEEGRNLKEAAEKEAERIIAEARQKAEELTAASKEVFERERLEAAEQGRLEGREAGYNDGKAEVERLVERTRTVLERAQDQREDILAETEQQIVDLVLLISRKVIKVISESQRNVVLSNVVQSLRKLKARGKIFIRVNIADVKLTTEHIKDFIQMVEGAQSIQVVEDSTVDPGGCVIETDFGEIDARIASQLAELETKILEISPIKGKAKAAPSGAGT